MISFIKKYKSLATYGGLYAVVLYSMLMTQQLTNTYDGLWHQNYRQAGNVELTSGRWLLCFVDKINMGLHADPITSLLALVFFEASIILIIHIFKIKNKWLAISGVVLFLSSTYVCNTVSYRYTSMGYGLSCFLAVLGMYALVVMKKRIFAILVSGMCLGLAMAGYQANLSVYAVTALFYLIYICLKKDEKFGDYLLNLILAVLFGGIFYITSLNFFLKITGASLSSYNGIGGITPLSLLVNLPQNILKTYKYFGVYYFSNTLKINCLQSKGLFFAVLGVLLIGFIFLAVKVWNRDKVKAIILLCAVAMMPIACNAYMLLAGDKLELQMTAGLAIMIPVAILVCYPALENVKVWKSAYVALCIIILYGNSMQVWMDQEAMYEGRNASVTMLTQVITDLKEEGLLSEEFEYYFIGVPARNQQFSVSDIYTKANGYAQMGNFWTSGSCGQMSYNGLLSKYMGYNLPMSYRWYNEFEGNEAVAKMPTFPEDGYIEVVDGKLVIIKISEYEKYKEYSLY